MSELVERVQHAILEQKLLRRGHPLLVGVSGGLDSMVLLHLLARLTREHACPLVVAHFNHQLRSAASDADEAFVRQTAKKLGLPCKTGRAQVGTFAKAHKLSIEMAARQLRHEFLARTAAATGCSTIALGHQADDQVELFFLRLLRGAGLDGLSGMKAKAPSPANPAITLIRPLLSCSRAQLSSFAQETGLEYREDASNATGTYQRNRIRHELLPLLRNQFQPAVDTLTLRLIEIISAESEFVAESTRQAFPGENGSFAGLPLALQRRWIRAECQRLGIEGAFELVETLRIRPGVEVMVSPGTVVALDKEGQLHVRAPVPSTRPGGETTLAVSLPGAKVFEGASITWAIQGRRAGAPIAPPSPGRERFDADKVGPVVRLRHWRAGDRFQPIGMKTAVKLQDLFVNQKIARAKRAALLVAETDSGEIFWVEGLRISEGFKLTAVTRRCLDWHWERAQTLTGHCDGGFQGRGAPA